MKSTRKGLRAGDLEKDTYGRLRCSSCEMDLDTENDPDVVGKVRACPECGAQWKEVG
ncbi:HVO_0758 family zinc finger protein [Halovenus salina]|uniref:HVO_0758 family zinc finger protein n=1 Tax=Halovenus salina TaxID=1510225 RepID=UPI0022609399|nr:HVO_0758 family zinc finger protein [Halovenus salina]